MTQKSTIRITKIVIMSSLIMVGSIVLLASCDDDPLVLPAGSEDDNCSGSYCKLEKNQDDFSSFPLALLNQKNNPTTF